MKTVFVLGGLMGVKTTRVCIVDSKLHTLEINP